jgi:hypothetical protein
MIWRQNIQAVCIPSSNMLDVVNDKAPKEVRKYKFTLVARLKSWEA